jgi:hypothetical protein
MATASGVFGMLGKLHGSLSERGAVSLSVDVEGVASAIAV